MIYVLLTYRDTIFKLVRNPLYVLIGIAAVGLLGYIFHAGQIIADFFQGETLSLFLFPVNNITYFRELVWRNYAFLSLPAFVGMFIGIYEKKYAWSVSLMLFLLFYSYLWIFRSTHNIRYIVPFIGIIFVYFGVFWGKVAEKLFPKYQLLFITMLIVILYMGGYKIVRKPNAYYSPNADLYGDVQNADYKTFFSILKKEMNKYVLADYVIINKSEIGNINKKTLPVKFYQKLKDDNGFKMIFSDDQEIEVYKKI